MASSKAGLISIVLQSKTTFKDIIAYRYVIATAAAGFVYTIIQIPFAIYHAIKEKRLFRNQFLPEFDFYADKMVAFLLATGVGAGFAITFELKKFVRDFLSSLENLGVDEGDFPINKFLDKANMAIGLLFLGFLCMAILSIFSSINRINTTTPSKSSRGCFK
ncbi:hypothetical protein ACOSP7_019236 [Xanthoceras sorbifolium]